MTTAASPIQVKAHPLKSIADRRARRRRFFSNAAGKGNHVHAAKRGDVGADVFLDAVKIGLHRESGVVIAGLRRGFQVA